MTCSQEEAKFWLKRNWDYLCENGKLGYALKHYAEVYITKTEKDEYSEIKRQLDKLAIDKTD